MKTRSSDSVLTRMERRVFVFLAIAALSYLSVSALAETLGYRPIDGKGNNVDHMEWGSAGVQLLRGPSGAHYGDGISSLAGASRPSPRAISNALFNQTGLIFSSVGHSDYIWTWGQFLDHDVGLTPGENEPVPIPVPSGDPFFDPFNTGTQVILFSRSVFDPLTGGVTPRQQINQITAYIDGSNVYGVNVGTDTDRPGWLRTRQGGRLKVTTTSVGDLLPYNDGTVFNVGTPEQPDNSTLLFVAGDVRANEQPTLAAMHTLFVREHNYQASRIAAANPGLDDDAIYQRARRMVIAEIQAITYEEFIPALLGKNALRQDRGYDPEVNAGIAQVFSTAAYRLGHTLLSPEIQHLDENGNSLPGGPLQLRDVFFRGAPPVLEAEGIEPILRGLAAQKSQELDNRVIDDVRNFLFGPPGAGGLDLISLNIQRGRDHGLPDFNTARAEFGLPPKDFSQITYDRNLAAKLARLYNNDAGDIDLFVGLLVERDMPGMIVGETLRAILMDQFERSRCGDRFFYTRYLSSEELKQVRAMRLSDIIKRNTTIANIQSDVFYVQGRGRN
ncbi:MAG TPA: peroxidase family protein [Terriglobia bacterium]|nr:peroxidase family protein [Terriglobia bacterium]